MAKIINVTEKDFDQVVLKSSIPVLADFWAPWCNPCVMMGPVLEQLAEALGDKIQIVKINVDGPVNKALAHKYDIMSIPNLKVFKNGEVVKEFGGFIPLAVLRHDVEEAL